MNACHNLLREKLADVVEGWRTSGLPTRSELEAEAQALMDWKRDREIPGLWTPPPLLVTATLDDGLGYGLQIIRLYAEVAGLKVISLGLNREPEEIVAECKRYAPDLVGLTVLQFSSEDALMHISENLPPKTRLIVGGSSIFDADPDFAKRCGVHFVAKSVASFVQYLLEYP